MTLTKTAKRTTTKRASGPHRVKPTRRAVHRNKEQGTRSKESGEPTVAAQNAAITVHPAFLAEVRDWTALAGVSLAAYLTAAIAIGVV